MQRGRVWSWYGALALLAACTDEVVPVDAAPDAGVDPSLVDPRPVTNGGSGPVDAGADATDSGSQAGAGAGARGSTSPPALLVFEPLGVEELPRRVVNFDFIPGTHELLVFPQNGGVRHYELVGDELHWRSTTTFPAHNTGECGLLTLAFDPDFETNRLLYYGYCVDDETWRIDQLVFDAENLQAAVDAAVTIIEVGADGNTQPWHNVGSIGFDASGALFIFAGEKTRSSAAQDPKRLLGKVLRIVPDRTGAGGYQPAPDNPFANGAEWAPEVFAMGLRNGFRGVLDAQGRYFFGDVGAAAFEEVNVITGPGRNFGWPAAEGPCSEGCADFVQPLTSWGRSSAHPYVTEDPAATASLNRSVYVGHFYEPVPNDPYQGRLDRHLIYGDHFVGYVRALVIDDDTNVLADYHVGHQENVVAWRLGPDGHLYVASRWTDLDDGSALFRAVLEDL